MTTGEDVLMGNLSKRLEQTELPESTQRLLALFPGILFGFPPPNLSIIKTRISCEKCLNIAERLMAVVHNDHPRGFKYRFPWVRKKWILKVLDAVKRFEEEDREHWGDKEAREVSKDFVTAYVKKDGWQYG